MEFTLNGKRTVKDQPVNLFVLVQNMGMDPEKVIVEHNGQVAERRNWVHTAVSEGDRVEVLRFVGGG